MTGRELAEMLLSSSNPDREVQVWDFGAGGLVKAVLSTDEYGFVIEPKPVPEPEDVPPRCECISRAQSRRLQCLHDAGHPGDCLFERIGS